MKARGFTIIEIIMVITILGVLSAFALPRFFNLNEEASLKTTNGAVANVKSAAGIAHVKWLSEGNQPATVELESAVIDMIYGYPSADTASTNGHIGIAAGLESVDWVLANPTANKMSITFKGYCFTYTGPAGLGSAPTVSTVQAAPCT
jgi:MSHA pilin protein MshA